MIIDFHTHAFPDSLAEKAMASLHSKGNAKSYLNGKISSLLKSMDSVGIEKSIICNIATKPSQFMPIIEWSKSIHSDRIIPLPSIHPADSDIKNKIKIISEEGFKGIKIHPYYQEFILDNEKVYPIYENVQKYNLFIISHAGYDIAFSRKKVADTPKILNVIKKFPELKFITSHFGGWSNWDEVEKHLIGKNIFMEISYSLECMSDDQAKRMLNNHPADYLLFGTDSPWTDQKNALNLLKSFNLDKERMDKILYKNAQKFLF